MKEIIESIRECSDELVKSEMHWSVRYDGFIVKTNKKEYRVLISSKASCCESFGYLQSENDLTDYIGAELIQVNIVDENKKLVEEVCEWGYDSGDILFVNFETSEGTFQLAVYNAHNGYYGHSVIIDTSEGTHEKGL